MPSPRSIVRGSVNLVRHISLGVDEQPQGDFDLEVDVLDSVLAVVVDLARSLVDGAAIQSHFGRDGRFGRYSALGAVGALPLQRERMLLHQRR